MTTLLAITMKTSSFFAYLTRIRWIKRWGLMRNAYHENVMEHSWEVATIAHTLALIKNRYYGGTIDANAIATAALYHDVTEVLTGDLPTPIKYHSATIEQAYKHIERQASQALINLLPDDLKADFQTLLTDNKLPEEHKQIIKSADKIAAYLKCQSEIHFGNQEFQTAAEEIFHTIQKSPLPEVHYFMQTFVPACGLTLDCLMREAT